MTSFHVALDAASAFFSHWPCFDVELVPSGSCGIGIDDEEFDVPLRVL